MRFFAKTTRARLLAGAASGTLLLGAGAAMAQEDARINIAPQSLTSALYEFGVQTDRQVMFTPRLTSSKLTAGVVAGDEKLALAQLLKGTGLSYRVEGDVFIIVEGEGGSDPQSESAAGGGADGTVDALIVTAQKREEDIQDVPIAISAFTQETLERSQVAGGPDLMTQVPNMTFTKTNFSSYSIQIRGIGTQAISATVDAAVAVAFNNSSMIRNRFFEQEFYDLQRVEVLRGPQGTLYGRNATAGVVNIISAKPKYEFEAKGSGDLANYGSTRLEGMVNLPLVEDMVALRVAGAWTKRDGYVTNLNGGDQIDGRDLWSTRVSLRFDPSERLNANLIWEHFEEDDDRLRSGKQLCKKHAPNDINGVTIIDIIDGGSDGSPRSTYSQGCLPTSMYADDAYQTPNGFALPYYGPLGGIGLPIFRGTDPYVSATQSKDLRVIESTLTPEYRAESDVVQLQASYDATPSLTIASETTYSSDELFSFQDFNRFNTTSGVFDYAAIQLTYANQNVLSPEGVFCDPQLGCADRMVLGDLSKAKSRQFSQELRISSDFEGAFNFSLGGNFLRYDTEDKYYVFANTLSLWAASSGEYIGTGVPFTPYIPNVTDNSHCLGSRRLGDPNQTQGVLGCIPIDPNSIHDLDDSGHNYFLSRNPYKLLSYAVFGEAYYQITPDLKLTAGLRWTSDEKEAPVIPSWLIASEIGGRPSSGYPITEVVRQGWTEPTGRLAIDWKPALSFTDETLLYASYAHGYKAGGMNPPPAVIALYTGDYGPLLRESIVQPKTFDAEFVDALEIGSKNTLLDGRLTLNMSAFHYSYENYQLSQIINRSAVTQNFDATVWGLELEADWRPMENLKLGLKAGYQRTKVADGEKAIDLMDRTAGDPYWIVARPFPTVPSNCILPVWLVTFNGRVNVPAGGGGNVGPCVNAYILGLDPVTQAPYDPNLDPNSLGPDWAGYPGFDPTTAPNNGEGIFKDLSGNELPNAPRLTTTITADYTVPLPNDWLLTLHGDFYRQSKAWTRIFNFDPYDRLKEYTNVNLAAIFTNENRGWNVMAYVKNVFDNDAITGAFLNSDDTGLTTNVFLLEPRLYGLRVSKQWTGGASLGPLFATRSGPPLLEVELGGSAQRIDAPNAPFSPAFLDLFSSRLDPRPSQGEALDWGDGREVKLTLRAEGPWSFSAGARLGRTNGDGKAYAEESFPWQPFGGEGYDKYTYVIGDTHHEEAHAIVDFTVGRDFGIGASSRLSLGVRYAELGSTSKTEITGTPEYYVPPTGIIPRRFTQYTSNYEASRTFEGAGPVVEWELSKALIGQADVPRLNLDAGASAAVLFGRQKALLSGGGYSDATVKYWYGYEHVFEPLPGLSERRSKSVTVPVLGAELGLSWQAQRFKASAGYRWERYFDAIDGGYLVREDKDRTIDGPYFKIAVGFGG